MPANPAIADTARIAAGRVRPSTVRRPPDGFIRPPRVSSRDVRPDPAKPWITAGPPNGILRSTGPKTGPRAPWRVSPSASTAGGGAGGEYGSSMLVTAGHQPRVRWQGININSQTHLRRPRPGTDERTPAHVVCGGSFVDQDIRSGNQNAASSSSMMSLSRCDRMFRVAVSSGSTFFAKNDAVATLPS